MIVWLEKTLTLAIHERQIAEHGGTQGVRDDTLVESALAKPRQMHSYGNPAPDLADLAAALAYGLARNRPFLDGNKQTAAVACETFLLLNGIALVVDDAELYPQYLALAEGRLTAEQFAAWLRPRCAALPAGDTVQEAKATYRVVRQAR